MKINEDNFVRQLKLGNEKALLYVMEQYGGIIKSVIYKHLYDFPHLREECMNDVFLGIWHNIGDFDGSRNSFKNWAAGIARFKSIDYLRKYQSELAQIGFEEVSVSKEDENLLFLLDETLSEQTSELLSCLKPSDRELFTRLYVDEQSMDEISQQTGVEKSVLYNRLSRGKKKIRDLFSKKKGVNTYEP